MYKRNALVFGTVCIMLVVLSILASGCARGIAGPDENPGAGDEMPDKLVFGGVPGEDQEKVSQRYGPFIDYLSDELDIPIEFFIGTDYSATIEAMRNGHVDIGAFGPFSYVIAESRSGCEAFAVSLRSPDASPVYYSYIIARKDRGFEELTDLQDQTFAFVDPASTSGHLFPRATLIQALKITNEELDDYFSSTRFSGGHDASFLAVLNGDIDGAAVSSNQWRRGHDAFAEHPEIDDLVILLESKPIPSSPTALRRDLPESLKDSIKEAFYSAIDEPSLQPWFEEHKRLGGYVATEDSNYDVIRETAQALNLGPDELLNR